MRALAILIAFIAVGTNVVQNTTNNTPEGIKRAHESRMKNLCQVNRIYCR
jgi:hypothetical protein